jgi:hypothetical protein
MAEQRLHEAAMLRLQRDHIRQTSAAAERATRLEALNATRTAVDAIERRRQAALCTGCGAADTAGWCGGCQHRAATEAAILKAAIAAVPVQEGAAERGQLGAVQAWLRAEVEQVVADAQAHGMPAEARALLARMTAENLATDYRRSALDKLGRTTQANKAAALARTAARHRSYFHTDTAERDATSEAAERAARERTARRLFAERASATRHPWYNSSGAAGLAIDTTHVSAAGAARARAAMRARLNELAREPRQTFG